MEVVLTLVPGGGLRCPHPGTVGQGLIRSASVPLASRLDCVRGCVGTMAVAVPCRFGVRMHNLLRTSGMPGLPSENDRDLDALGDGLIMRF